MIRKLLPFLLFVVFLVSPFQTVFAEEDLSASEAELYIPVYFFADEHGGVLGIAPLSDEVVVWAYALGNITSAPLGSYTYSETNYANPHAVTQIGSTGLTYDNNGNVTAYGGNTYGWNYRDRLISSNVGGTLTLYGYDFNNERVTKGNGTATTTYANKYYNVLGATTTKHIYDNAGLLLATVEGNGISTTTNYVHTDHLGGTSIVTDEEGAVVESTDYYPYGSQRINTGTFTEQRKYIGEQFDEESDLSYLNARYYSGDRGQFLSQDPVFWEVGQTNTGKVILQNPQLLNSYSYAAGNPITGKDPDGKLVELISRPIQGSLGTVGAHSFVAVIPENSKTVGSITGVNTSRPFTLGGYTTGVGDLFKAANADSDYAYAFGNLRNEKGIAQVIVNPPPGVSAGEFDRRVLESYNALPGNISNSYGFMGQKRFTGNPNSNNVSTDILLGAGVTSGQINSYQASLYAQNLPRITPGLGTSASASTYGQSLNATLGALKGTLTKLLSTLSSSNRQ